MNLAKNMLRTALICLLLGAVTLIAFWPQTGHDFIAYDDVFYLTGNAHVQGDDVGKRRLGLPHGRSRQLASADPAVAHAGRADLRAAPRLALPGEPAVPHGQWCAAIPA